MENLKIVFYTEAGTSRGMGHLVRCYTIFKEFKQRYPTTLFFLDSDIDYNYKFEHIEYFKWNNFEINEEYDIIFIDSYEADIKIYNQLQKLSKLTVYIDDYSRLKYPKGVIINFAPDAETLFFTNKLDKYNYMLGLKYIPIRDEFIKIKKEKQKQIFIMLGGSDTSNLSIDIIDTLKDIDIQKVIVSNKKETISKLNKYKNTKVLYKPSDDELISYMANSSIAISTASMTLYELSYLQVPTIIIAVSKNQFIGMNQSINNNIAILGLTIEQDWGKKLQKSIMELIEKEQQLESKIDGIGTQRIINQTIELVA